MPGNLISSTKQLGAFGRLLCNNSGADPNTLTRKPTDWKRLASDSRMAKSSSMTRTTGSSPATPLGNVGRVVTGVQPSDAIASYPSQRVEQPNCALWKPASVVCHQDP